MILYTLMSNSIPGSRIILQQGLMNNVLTGLWFVVHPFGGCKLGPSPDSAEYRLAQQLMAKPRPALESSVPLVHNWSTDKRLDDLPDTIEDYFTPETVVELMKWIIGKDRIPEMALADYCSTNMENGKSPITDVLVEGKMPVQLFNLYVAHENWEEVHEKLNVEFSKIARLLRKVNLWNTASELKAARGGAPPPTTIMTEDILNETSYTFFTDTEDEDVYKRRRKAGKSANYETDCETVFGQENKVLADAPRTSPEASNAPDIGTVHTKKLLEQYAFYTNRCKESIVILNTFVKLESFIVQTMRTLATKKDTDAAMHQHVLDQLTKIDVFSRHTMQKSQTVLQSFDDKLSMMKHTQECFHE